MDHPFGFDCVQYNTSTTLVFKSEADMAQAIVDPDELRRFAHNLDRFNRDSHFANAFPANEDHTDQGYRFNLGVDYRPSIARSVE